MQTHSELIVTDSQLVDAARLGDRSAFGELIRRHRQRCVSLAVSILRDLGEAEEETQSACWKAFEHLGQFHGDAEFSSWLSRIVKNQCLMLLRSRRGVQFVHLDERRPTDGNEPVQLTSPGIDPEVEFGSREIWQVLQAEIGCIPILLRNVLVLRDVQGLPISALAEQLGITETAAKSRLVRARIELRHRMQRHCGKAGAWSLIRGGKPAFSRALHSSERS
jgi:RNA polymerase sigma-70 factor, ECF subfamily